MERWVGGYKDGWIAEQPQHRAVSPCIVSPGQGTQGGAEWYSRASEGIVTGTEMTPGLSPRPGPPTSPLSPPPATLQHSPGLGAASRLLPCKLHGFSLLSAPVSGHEDQRRVHGDIEQAQFCAAIYKANWNTAVPLGSWRGVLCCTPSRKRALLHLLSAPLFTVVVQSLSRVRLFATSWTAAPRASLSITNFQSCLKLMSIESVMPSSHLILCRPLLLLPSILHSIRVFSGESLFTSGGQSIGASTSASVLSVNIQD